MSSTAARACLYFRGRRNVDAVLDWLVEHKGMDKATHIVVSGESAGGTAAYWHADSFKRRFPAAHVVGVPDSVAKKVVLFSILFAARLANPESITRGFSSACRMRLTTIRPGRSSCSGSCRT